MDILNNKETIIHQNPKIANILKFQEEGIQICRICLETSNDNRLNKLNPITNDIREMFRLSTNFGPQWICIKCETVILKYTELLSLSLESEELFSFILNETLNEQNVSEIQKEHNVLEADNNKTDNAQIDTNLDLSDQEMHEEYLVESELSANEYVDEDQHTENTFEVRERITTYILENQSFKCIICNKISSSKKLHHSHFACMHSRPHECPVEGCGKAFGIPGQVRKHIRQVHSGEAIRKYALQKSYVKKRKSADDKASNDSYLCGECGQTFLKQSRLTLHLKQVHEKLNIPCEICGKLFNETKLKIHIKGHDPKYECDLCHKRFMEKFLLKRHIQFIHLGIVNYQCKDCGLGYETSQRLRAHWLKIHSDSEYKTKITKNRKTQKSRAIPDELKGYCQYCGLRFELKSELIRHVKGHTLVYNCNICSKRFASEVSLQHHAKTHLGKVYPFACSICECRYLDKSTLSKHVSRVHEARYLGNRKQPTEKTIKCFLCELHFSVGRRLKEHLIAVHTESRYQCPNCSVRCISQRGIESHLKREHPDLFETQNLDVSLYFERDEPTHTNLLEQYSRTVRNGATKTKNDCFYFRNDSVLKV